MKKSLIVGTITFAISFLAFINFVSVYNAVGATGQRTIYTCFL